MLLDLHATPGVRALQRETLMKHAILGMLLAACTVGEAGPTTPGTDAPQQSGDDAAPVGASVRIIAGTQMTNAPAQFAPANSTVVWVEGPGGFVKTIDRQAGVRKQHLVTWTAAAGATDADAVSGASRTNHATPLDITWDLKDRTGAVVADGMYTIKMELADENATAATENNEGVFTFVKGATAQNQTGLSNGGFTNVSIDFQPN